LVELLDGARFLLAERPIPIDEKATALLTPEAVALLGGLLQHLEAVTPWSADALEAGVRDFADRAGVKLGAVAQPLRAAVTGRTTSPGIFEVLAVLGREDTLGRLHDQVSVAADPR
jgi:glutamyl-tRNA synthetase